MKDEMDQDAATGPQEREETPEARPLDARKPYSTPELIRQGDMRELTQGAFSGTADAPFGPGGTNP